MSTALGPSGGDFKLCPKCHHIYPAGSGFCARDGEALVADDRILAGKFILVRKIGEGNMGAVYEAEQPQMGRTVAVKVLRTDPEVMLRFEREVQASGALNHANVVTVFDSGLTTDGRGYIAMEYLEGESLGHYLERQGPLPVERALALWIQAVRAMSAAHAKGIVHRDLKPENLFLASRPGDEGGEAERTVLKVLDFGIAKFSQRALPAKGTAPGMVIGTMQYMAPEQMQGAEADPRADVYALGLILVEMLTARLPWGDSKEQAYAQFALRIVVPPTPLSKLRPDTFFSPELTRLVEDMLALEASRRPANGAELLQRVKAIKEAQPILRSDGGSLLERSSSSAISVIERAAPLPGTERVAALPGLGAVPAKLRLPLLVTVVGLLLLLAGGVFYLLRSGAPAPVVATAAPDLAPPSAQVLKPAASAAERTGDGAATAPVSKPAQHRSGHSGATLQVQFAFTDAKGVTLSCGGKRLPPPECSGSGLCKAVAQVGAGQRCVVEKAGQKKVISYADLQKNQPDRKNLIHFLVRLP